MIDASGGASGPYEGSYITGWYPVESDARWDAMKKVISEQAFGDNRIDPADAGVQTTWIAYTVLKAAVESLGDGEVSSDSVRRALDDGLKVHTGGLTPTLPLGVPGRTRLRRLPAPGQRQCDLAGRAGRTAGVGAAGLHRRDEDAEERRAELTRA